MEKYILLIPIFLVLFAAGYIGQRSRITRRNLLRLANFEGPAWIVLKGFFGKAYEFPINASLEAATDELRALVGMNKCLMEVRQPVVDAREQSICRAIAAAGENHLQHIVEPTPEFLARFTGDDHSTTVFSDASRHYRY